VARALGASGTWCGGDYRGGGGNGMEDRRGCRVLSWVLHGGWGSLEWCTVYWSIRWEAQRWFRCGDRECLIYDGTVNGVGSYRKIHFEMMNSQPTDNHVNIDTVA
jgi:hypothetical protein